MNLQPKHLQSSALPGWASRTKYVYNQALKSDKGNLAVNKLDVVQDLNL